MHWSLGEIRKSLGHRLTTDQVDSLTYWTWGPEISEMRLVFEENFKRMYDHGNGD